jgi:hypothetical protein
LRADILLMSPADPPATEHDGGAARTDADRGDPEPDVLTGDDRRAPLTADDRATLRYVREKRLRLLPGDGFDR